MTQVLQCTNNQCTHVFPKQNLINDKCPLCGGAMKDITGTKLGNDFIAIIQRVPPQVVKNSYMNRHLSTFDGEK